MHISCEGNIASGKSTFLARLQERIFARGLNIKMYMEPIEIWTNFNGVNVLEKMYKEPKRYSYLFQTMAFTTKIDQLYPAIKMGQNFIAERSVMSQLCLFVPSLFENGAIKKWTPQGSWRPTWRTCARGRRSSSTGTAGAERDLTVSQRTAQWLRTVRLSWCD
jgi:deoxyadenosine/deoxycytidine kinase